MSTDAYVLHGYRLTNLMMTGQTSQVWEAVQEGSGRRYAVKLLLPERIEEAEHRKYIETEAKVGKSMTHPKIIKIFEYYPEKTNPHFVMEFFPSQNLKMRIIRRDMAKEAKDRVKEAEYLRTHAHSIIEQAADALAYMHDKGWLHKDIKPDNLLLNGIGDVRLIDFALAERIGSRWARLFSKRGIVSGTRSYMSPEQIRGERLDERADLYSFGCTVFELLTGRPPFRADSPKMLLEKHLYDKARTPKSLNPDLTPEVDDLIMRTLEKKAKDRVENLHEFVAQFRALRVFSNSVEQGTAKK